MNARGSSLVKLGAVSRLRELILVELPAGRFQGSAIVAWGFIGERGLFLPPRIAFIFPPSC
jgi:hypothetical protein